MSVMANGWESREKSRLAVKRIPKQEDNSLVITTSQQSDDEMVDVKHFSTTGSSALQVVTTPAPKRPNVRLDSLIMEAITTLKEPGGSNKTAIGAYIELNSIVPHFSLMVSSGLNMLSTRISEVIIGYTLWEQYHAPLDFKRVLSTKLKYLTACGKLVKVKRKYRIPNSTPLSSHRRRSLGAFPGKQRTSSSLPSPKTDRDEVNTQTMSQIDTEAWAVLPRSAEAGVSLPWFFFEFGKWIVFVRSSFGKIPRLPAGLE
ncbi:unnamed protein product [Arabis nemorensis]|uniref:H15 domain-containing protein n=1 Tax=Arabis nemorensis TaxID=586526 RepID=A0A565BHR3_9BRAS|nr:unnamed protein product [Arabis nemorensis]